MGQYALTFEVPGEEVESMSLWLVSNGFRMAASWEGSGF
jgi:hypothetical protein